MASKKDYPSMEDVALWKASQRGDMRAFEELVARHRDKIYARAFSMIRNEEDAVDPFAGSVGESLAAVETVSG
jgi:hypothetical protein